jgi:hypothetical protein
MKNRNPNPHKARETVEVSFMDDVCWVFLRVTTQVPTGRKMGLGKPLPDKYCRVMKIRRWSLLITISGLAVLTAGALLPFPWLARESIFEFTARNPKSKDVGEPDGPAPNGIDLFRSR